MLPLATALFLAVLPVSAAPPVIHVDANGAPKVTELPAWWSRLNAGAPGSFPPPRPFKASYGVSWEGLDAARFDSQCTLPEKGAQISTLVKARTIGMARTLWKFDASNLSLVDRQTLRPTHIEQIEDQGRKHSDDRLDFSPQGVTRTTAEGVAANGEARPPRTRRINYPGLFDMESAFLYMRSLPLAVGETRTMALMTSGSPYLVTVKVVGQGKVQVKAGEFPAFEYALSLEKIDKYGDLTPRKGFKSAHAWISDDADRLIIKAQADVFVGTVTVELENVQFTDDTAPAH